MSIGQCLGSTMELRVQIEQLQAEKQEPVAWVGCGECDCEFPCYHGKTTCLRLPTEKQEPVAWIDGGDLREVCNGNSRYVHCDNQGRMVPLYTRPQPDLTAEVERLKLSAEHWNRLYRERCQEFHDAQANKGQEIVWLIDRIAELEEAARKARDAFEQHDGNYKLSKASGAVVEAAIAKLDAVLGNA